MTVPLIEVDRAWHDAARDRDVPARLRWPDAPAARPWPVVVMSHGLGASRACYTYLGRHIAALGRFVVHVEHAGTDREALRQFARRRVRRRSADGAPSRSAFEELAARLVADPAALAERPRDVSFALDALAGDPELAPRLDLDRVAVVGHSLGAYTALACAGLESPFVHGASDPRVAATVALSPQGPGTMGLVAGAWDAIESPSLLVTGTLDAMPGGPGPAWRRASFDGMKRAERFFVVIEGATHFAFTDEAIDLDSARRAFVHATVCTLVATFLRGALDGDRAALDAWHDDATTHAGFTLEAARPGTTRSPADPL